MPRAEVVAMTTKDHQAKSAPPARAGMRIRKRGRPTAGPGERTASLYQHKRDLSGERGLHSAAETHETGGNKVRSLQFVVKRNTTYVRDYSAVHKENRDTYIKRVHTSHAAYRVCPKVTNTCPILPPLSTRFGPPFIAIVTVFRSVYMKRKPRMPSFR